MLFGKKFKELQSKNSELLENQKEMKQRINLLESEVKRLVAILDFLSYRKKTEDREVAPNPSELNVSHGINDILIPDSCVQKINDLANIEFATKEDINRIDVRFLEIFNTISGLFKAFGNAKNTTTTTNKIDDISPL